MEFQFMFELAMKRKVPRILFQTGVSINLGAGSQVISRTTPLDYPDWDADLAPLPYEDASVNQIHAYHFLEHVKEPVKVLQECQRVLTTGGLMNIAVPYFSSQIAHQDLDHKHFFTENTWRTLFNNHYYDKNRIEWKFKIGFNMICGLIEKDIMLLTQLIKE